MLNIPQKWLFWICEFNNEESRALLDTLHKSEEPWKPFNTVKKFTTDITNNLYFRIGKHRLFQPKWVTYSYHLNTWYKLCPKGTLLKVESVKHLYFLSEHHLYSFKTHVWNKISNHK